MKPISKRAIFLVVAAVIAVYAALIIAPNFAANGDYGVNTGGRAESQAEATRLQPTATRVQPPPTDTPQPPTAVPTAVPTAAPTQGTCDKEGYVWSDTPNSIGSHCVLADNSG